MSRVKAKLKYLANTFEIVERVFNFQSTISCFRVRHGRDSVSQLYF